MLTPKEYTALKGKIDSWQSKSDKLQGQIEEVQRTLKSEFGVETIEDARALQAKLQRDYEKAELNFTQNYEEFKEKWETVLS